MTKLGDKKSAKLFSITVRSAQSWRLGDREPRVRQARRVLTLTKKHPIGKVYGFDEIYGVYKGSE